MFFKNILQLHMRENYLKIFLKDARKLLSLNFIVIYP